MWQERSTFISDPLLFVINLIKSGNTVTGRLITDYINSHVLEIKQAMQSIINSISESDSSRRLTHKDINPKLNRT